MIISKTILEKGVKVRTLTNAVGRDDPFDGKVEVHSLDFDNNGRDSWPEKRVDVF